MLRAGRCAEALCGLVLVLDAPSGAVHYTGPGRVLVGAPTWAAAVLRLSPAQRYENLPRGVLAVLQGEDEEAARQVGRTGPCGAATRPLHMAVLPPGAPPARTARADAASAQ